MSGLDSSALHLEPSADEHVLRAAGGDQASWAWLVGHYSPLLEVQARFRLGQRLRCLYDPDDLVNDVWLIVCRRLPELDWPAQGASRRLLHFLGSTLVFRVNELVRKNLRRAGRDKDLAFRTSLPGSGSALAASTRSACSRAAHEEHGEILRQRLARLRPEEGELLVLRLLEGLPNAHLAQRYGCSEGALSMRFRRALDRLRDVLPAAVLAELERS